MTEGRRPTAAHPITVTPHPHPVTVRVNGQVVAHSERALELRESTYRPVFYIPRADVAMDALSRTEHRTHCPYKGDASYFTIATGGDVRENAVWSYEAPFEWLSEIRDHMAFYPDRVDSIEG